MPHELVGEAQALAIQNASMVEHNRVLERTSLREPRRLQRLHLAEEAKGASRSNRAGERLRTHGQ